MYYIFLCDTGVIISNEINVYILFFGYSNSNNNNNKKKLSASQSETQREDVDVEQGKSNWRRQEKGDHNLFILHIL